MMTDNKSDDALLAQGVAGTSQQSAVVLTQLEGHMITMSDTLKILGQQWNPLLIGRVNPHRVMKNPEQNVLIKRVYMD